VNSSTKYHYLIETNIGTHGADPCSGDSGGPLLLEGDDLQWTLVGVVLGGGFSCENPEGKDTTSDWNKISIHVPWIKSIIEAQTGIF
jgi:secreted trypsin-like serine protease